MPTASETLSPDQVWVLIERVRESDEWRAFAALLRAQRDEKTRLLVSQSEFMEHARLVALAGEIRGLEAALRIIEGQETHARREPE